MEIGVKYRKFGFELLIDNSGAQTNAIERACFHDAEEINCKIFQKWLQGNGRQLVTWNTLILVLQQIGLEELAKEISSQVQFPQIPLAASAQQHQQQVGGIGTIAIS